MSLKLQNPVNHRIYKVFTLFDKCCSDRDRIRTYDRLLRRQMLYPAELRDHFKSGWQDSNLRPPRPKRGAITGLRYTPNGYLLFFAERQGFEPWRQLPVDRLAICSITTLAPLLKYVYERIFASANVTLEMDSHNIFHPFFHIFFNYLFRVFNSKVINIF